MSELTKKVMAAIAPLLAKDAKPEEIEAAVEKVAKDEETRAERDNESEAERLKREEKELKEREERERKDRDRDRAEDDDEDDEDDETVSKTAMDSAIRLAVDGATKEAAKNSRRVREAEKIVRPLIGDVVAMDSADDVYRTALEQSGVDIKDVHPSAYPALVQMAISQKQNSRPAIAQDSASISDFEKAFPTAGKLKRGF